MKESVTSKLLDRARAAETGFAQERQRRVEAETVASARERDRRDAVRAFKNYANRVEDLQYIITWALQSLDEGNVEGAKKFLRQGEP